MTQTLGQWYIEEGKKEGLSEGLKQGQLRALRDTLRIQLEERFQTLPEALRQRIETTTDAAKLQSCLRQVLRINSPEELQF